MYARIGGIYNDDFTYMFTAWDNEHWNKLNVCLLYTSHLPSSGMGAGPWLGPFFTTHLCSTSCE